MISPFLTLSYCHLVSLTENYQPYAMYAVFLFQLFLDDLGIIFRRSSITAIRIVNFAIRYLLRNSRNICLKFIFLLSSQNPPYGMEDFEKKGRKNSPFLTYLII